MAEPGWVRIIGLALPPRYRREVIADLLDEREALVRSGCSAVYATRWLFGHLLLSVGASWRHRPRPLRRAAGGSAGFGSRGPGPVRSLRQAARSLWRTPWYAATIALIVAMSIALAATVFAIVDGVLFRPLPYPDAHELYAVGGVFDDSVEPSGRGIELLSNREVTTWSVGAPDVVWTGLSYTQLQLPDGAPIGAVGVDRQFIDVFGARMAVGGFAEGQLAPIPRETRTPKVVPAAISHRVWQDDFEGDPAIVGRIVRPPGFLAIPYEIVGVLAPDGFVPPLPAATGAWAQVDAIVPWMTRPDFGERGMVAFARVPDGQLHAMIASLNLAVADDVRTRPPLSAGLTPVQIRARAPYVGVEFQPLSGYLTRRERPLFTIAFVVVIGLVAIVVLNAGALAAARAGHRAREVSLRRALGARTRDLVRDTLAEQTVLGIPGVVLGLSLCPLLLGVARDLLPPGLNLIKDATVDWRVAAFAGLLTCATSVLVAMFPLRIALGQNRLALTRLSAREQSPGRRGLGRALVAGQVALAFVMILGGVFFSVSLARVWSLDPGFRTHGAALLQASADDLVPRTEAAEIASTLRRVPGVSGAAVSAAAILRPAFERSSFRLPDVDAVPDLRPPVFEIGQGFFEVTGIRLLDGRLPSDAELATGAPVVAVSDLVAREYWPGRNAVGQTLLDPRRQPVTVVGVVADIRWQAPDLEPEGTIYAPWLDAAGRRRAVGFEVFVTFEGDASTSLASAMSGVRAAHPGYRITQVRMVEDALVETQRARRLSALAASVFGGVALVVVAVGLLGLVAMTASRRTREVGIRMALGARPTGIVRQLIGEQVGAVVAGLVAGGAIAAWAVRFVQGHLYDTPPTDPTVWASTVGVMLATAVLGSAIPAIRASRIDPVRALSTD